MDLKDAIAKLDPANDAHWTDEGLPRLDALSSLAGRKVTRGEIDSTVNRHELLATLDAAPPLDFEANVAEQNLDAEHREAEDEVSEIENYLAKANVELDRRRKVRDDLMDKIIKRDEAKPGHAFEPFAQYLENEQRKRDERAASLNKVL